MKSDCYSQYLDKYKNSIDHSDEFWKNIAKKHLDWHVNFSEVKNVKNSSVNPNIKWFSGGKLNACYNCLDRFIINSPEIYNSKIAYYWQGDEPNDKQHITYLDLYKRVCKFSNLLLKLKIKPGDKVCIYLPLSIEAIIAILACARIGAVHTVVFAGFSANSLAERIIDSSSKLLITSDQSKRGNKLINLSQTVTDCLRILDDQSYNLNNLVCVNNFYSKKDFRFNLNNHIETIYYNDISTELPEYCEPVFLASDTDMFILYTSGSTGKPKGVVHSLAGYMLYSIYSFDQLFHVTSEDVFWCTADIGWITGHTYLLYGALGNGATSVIFSGTPNYPDYSIFGKLIDEYKVTVFYTAPTAIRAIKQDYYSQEHRHKCLDESKRETLRLLGSVGEPINAEVWQWYFDCFGKKQCNIIDTWWQTETGACMIAPLDFRASNNNIDKNYNLKPGCAMLPFYGIEPVILDESYNVLPSNNITGNLFIASSWPGMMKTIYQDHDRFLSNYFIKDTNNNYYFKTGDIAKRDNDGHYWLLGRGDDVINIAGHRLGTAEFESSLNSHAMVAESAVVAVPDEIKGQSVHAYIVLNNQINIEHNTNLIQDLKSHVRQQIGQIAIIGKVLIVKGLPKTRSGKIMRRVLKNISLGDYKNFGDLSTLTNPDVIDDILKQLHNNGL